MSVKAAYWRVRSLAWMAVKWPITRLAKPLGYTFLNKPQTIAYLNDYRIATHPASVCPLSAVTDVADPDKLIHPPASIATALSYVWRYESGTKPTVVLPCGLLQTEGNILNTDYWTDDALLDSIRPRHRPARRVRILLAPLGHYFDGNKFVGYYDFMFLVAAKICRIKEAAPEADFREAVVAYPLVHTRYEREFLDLMGFGPERIVDSRQTAVLPEICYIGNHANWMHQSRADVLLLKKHLEPLIGSPRTGRNRVYISRAGRRRVRNEAALTAMLATYGFLVIDDIPRSLAEQYAIYHNASVIVGPHGASFTNLLWCEPGTQVLELFTARFVATHFQYLAEVLGLRYAAYCHDADPGLDYGAIADDISVSVPDLERCVQALLTASVQAPA